MFTDKSGEYLIQGQIVKLSGDYPTDITAGIQSSLAKETLAKANTDDMIIYPATSQHKASIYVLATQLATTAECYTRISSSSMLAVLRCVIWRGHAQNKTYRSPKQFGAAKTEKQP